MSTRQPNPSQQVADCSPHGVAALRVDEEAAIPDAHLQRPVTPVLQVVHIMENV